MNRRKREGMLNMTNKECEHDFVIADVFYTKKYEGYVTAWTRISMYYCKKCLKEVEKKKEEYLREKPDWYKG